MFSRCVVALLLVTITGLFPPALLAQPDKTAEVKSMGNKDAHEAPAGAAHSASGVVKKIDASSGKVLIEHGPVKSLNWPAMTMSFVVKDKKLLDKLAVDKKADFEFVQQGDQYVVTAIK
jgi:Cu(I)/Ag(I) efflux system protein CusF